MIGSECSLLKGLIVHVCDKYEGGFLYISQERYTYTRGTYDILQGPESI